jgi:transposase
VVLADGAERTDDLVSVCNWALVEWNRRQQPGEKPSEAGLRRQLNAIKREQFLWILPVPRSVRHQAIKNRGAAFQRFFNKPYPRFKKNGYAMRQAWSMALVAPPTEQRKKPLDQRVLL